MGEDHYEFTIQTFAKEEWIWSLSFKRNYEIFVQLLNLVPYQMNVYAEFIFVPQPTFHVHSLKVQSIIMVKIVIFSSD